LSCGSGLASAYLLNTTMKTRLSQGRQGFTLVEIMIVVAIIALLASIAVPGFLRARKRSQASRIINDLRLIDNAIDMYAIESNKATGNAVNVADWTKYMKVNTNLYLTGKDIFGNMYGNTSGQMFVDVMPKCPNASWLALSDVTDTTFWSPYGHN
jgi:prepilin-type N-terminal cleavage/methylation domain-containing protein